MNAFGRKKKERTCAAAPEKNKSYAGNIPSRVGIYIAGSWGVVIYCVCLYEERMDNQGDGRLFIRRAIKDFHGAASAAYTYTPPTNNRLGCASRALSEALNIPRALVLLDKSAAISR